MSEMVSALLMVDGRAVPLQVDIEALRALVGPAGATVFSSVSLPPAVSRRAFARRCRGIPEAVRSGRTWVCPADAWWAACRRGSAPRAVPQGDTDATALLASAGLRLKGGGRGR